LVPASFVPIADTPFDGVAALRVNRMDGPIKFGSHVTWRQNSLEEIDRQTFDTYTPAVMKMVMGYYFDDLRVLPACVPLVCTV
jgi:L-2-hydroxyglutarate oxidase LhgO